MIDWYSHPIPIYRDRYWLIKTVQFWTVRFHKISLSILGLLIILDYFITV